MARELDASVVIPTHNRAPLLDRVLASFAAQSTDPSVFELIVVDDGSTDDTEDVCRAYAGPPEVVYLRIEQAGAGAAKNAGIAAARGRLVVLADDDDLADTGLVAAHIRAHADHPGTETAVLGYGTWDPELPVTELMHFVTEVGQFLSSYRALRDGDVLDFQHFWSGRISLKRELLLASGGFDEQMAAAVDIELGYRLSALGLRIVFAPDAVSYMLRSFDFDAFCERCERTGRGLAHFRIRHPGPVADEYDALVLGPRAENLRAVLDGRAERLEAAAAATQKLLALRTEVHSLEQRLEARGRLSPASPLTRLSPARRRLHRLYGDAFRTAIFKGALTAGELDG